MKKSTCLKYIIADIREEAKEIYRKGLTPEDYNLAHEKTTLAAELEKEMNELLKVGK